MGFECDTSSHLETFPSPKYLKSRNPEPCDINNDKNSNSFCALEGRIAQRRVWRFSSQLSWCMCGFLKNSYRFLWKSSKVDLRPTSAGTADRNSVALHHVEILTTANRRDSQTMERTGSPEGNEVEQRGHCGVFSLAQKTPLNDRIEQ